MRPFTLLIKPAGPDCNLKCAYCFYTDKVELFGTGVHRMGAEVLAKLVSDYMGLGFATSGFAWQGGEPTLMGLDFYKEVVSLQKQFGRGGQVVSNALQTNGVLLDDAWCDFLDEYKFLVGVSLDGPSDMHDHYRRDGAGKGSYDRVSAAIERCRTHNVAFNVLVLLNDVNVTEPERLFDFFVERRIRFLQFIPCVEHDPARGRIARFSATPSQYGGFLCRLFDRWIEHGPEKISVRLFDSIMMYLAHGRHSNCTLGQRCDDYVVVEHNGDVFCCDFFVTEQWKLGNVLETPIAELVDSPIKRDFARRKRQVANQCLLCRHHAICRGGCLKDRLAAEGDWRNPSYFCTGYQKFFDHALGKLRGITARAACKQ